MWGSYRVNIENYNLQGEPTNWPNLMKHQVTTKKIVRMGNNISSLCASNNNNKVMKNILENAYLYEGKIDCFHDGNHYTLMKYAFIGG